MEEIKSSFRPIDKLIESFNEPIYTITVTRKIHSSLIDSRFEVYLCSNTKSVRNKLLEIVNNTIKKNDVLVTNTYIEHVGACREIKKHSCHTKHKLFDYMDFIMEGNEMEGFEYVFSEIKNDCPQDILLEIAKAFCMQYEIKITKQELLVD